MKNTHGYLQKVSSLGAASEYHLHFKIPHPQGNYFVESPFHQMHLKFIKCSLDMFKNIVWENLFLLALPFRWFIFSDMFLLAFSSMFGLIFNDLLTAK